MSENHPEIVKEYIKVLRPCLHFHGIQIKSEEAFHRFAFAVQIIEEQCGIHGVVISLEEIFVCPWIGIEVLEPRTPMENLIKNLICTLKTTHEH